MKKETFIAIAAVVCLGILPPLVWQSKAAEGDLLWSRKYGGNQNEQANAIIPSGDGGFLLAGWTSSYGAGETDMWLFKVNDQGDSLWSKTYGGSSWDEANAIASTADGGFLLAGFTCSFGSYDMWLVKVNSNGDSLWSRAYGGMSQDIANSMITSADGCFLSAGHTFSFGSGSEDMWLVKVNAQGDSLWSQTYGGTVYDNAHSITASGDGGFMLAGASGAGPAAIDAMLVKVSDQGDQIWSRTYWGSLDNWANSVIPSGDGGYILAGVTSLPSFDAWLLKVDDAGEPVWSQTYDSLSEAFCTIPSQDGGFLFVGQAPNFGAGIMEIYLDKVNSQGEQQWHNTYGGFMGSWARVIIPSGEGNYLIAGGTADSLGLYADMLLLKVAGPGTPVIEPQISSKPIIFTLSPCYPNPFNSMTAIRFTLPSASFVNLDIFVNDGRRIPDMKMDASIQGWYDAGVHEVRFDGSGLASGIYIARLQAGDFVGLEKLVLLK